MKMPPEWLKVALAVAITTASTVAYMHTFFVPQPTYVRDVVRIEAKLDSLLLLMVHPASGQTLHGFTANDFTNMQKNAWEAALGLAKVVEAERAGLQWPFVVYHPHTRYVRNHMNVFPVRFCGGVDPMQTGVPPHLVDYTEVQIYALPDEGPLIYATLVHEYLHVIYSHLLKVRAAFDGRAVDEEAWVRGLFPAQCEDPIVEAK
jgi:hypothetical protein